MNMVDQTSFKAKTLSTLRLMVRIMPRSKLLYFLCRSYIEKYQNYVNVDMYRNGEHLFLKTIIQSREKPVVFDVGANVGEWTRAVLGINPGALVHAFEPFAEAHQELCGQGFGENVIINNLGLGDTTKQQDFYVYDDASAHNTLHKRHDRQPSAVQTIQIDTVSNYCQRQHIEFVDYLKIDVEGNDYSVLRGAEDLFRERRIYAAQFEYGDNYIDARVFLKDVFDFLTAFDYSLYRIMPKGLEHIRKYHHHHENFMYSNYAIVLKDQID